MAKSTKTPLAINIASLRKQKGWNQEELATKVGVHVNTVKLIERGLSTGQPKTRAAIAEALGVDEGTLFADPNRATVARKTVGEMSKEELLDLLQPKLITQVQEAKSKSLAVEAWLDGLPAEAYLNVSKVPAEVLEELGAGKRAAAVSDEELRLIAAFRALPKNRRHGVLDQMERLGKGKASSRTNPTGSPRRRSPL